MIDFAVLGEFMEVCRDLDAFQRKYESSAWSEARMPGNDLYSGLQMAIVKRARDALDKARIPLAKENRTWEM